MLYIYICQRVIYDAHYCVVVLLDHVMSVVRLPVCLPVCLSVCLSVYVIHTLNSKTLIWSGVRGNIARTAL